MLALLLTTVAAATAVNGLRLTRQLDQLPAWDLRRPSLELQATRYFAGGLSCALAAVLVAVL